MKRGLTSLVIREMQFKSTISPHVCYNGHHQKVITNAAKNEEEREPLCTAGGIVNKYGKQNR